MTYRVCIYPTGKSLGPASRSLIYDARTEAEAIGIGTAELGSVSCDANPFVFEIFDPSDRLILSYTSAIRPVDEGLHPGRP